MSREDPNFSDGALLEEQYRRKLDIEFFFVAIRQVERAAEFIRDEVAGGATIQSAIDSFRRSVPDSRKYRNALEHFEGWDLGRGHQQKNKVRPVVTYSYGEADAALHIVGEGAPVSIQEATRAARALYQACVDLISISGDDANYDFV